MKNIFRASVFGLVTTAFLALTAVSGFAQTANPCDEFDAQSALYTKFQENRKKPLTVDKYKIAIQSGEEFLSKYQTCTDQAKVITFIKEKLPEMKEYVKKQEMYASFNTAVQDAKTVNPSLAFSSGRQIIATDPDSNTALDVTLALTGIGYDNVTKATPDNTFNNDTINLAKTAIAKIEAGKTTESFGAWGYNYAVRDAQKKVILDKSKENALGWLNFTIGTIMYFGQKNEKDALPYYYKAAQYDSPIKNRPRLYQAIGAWYLAELLKIDEQRLAKVKINGDKDNDETLTMFALEKGYADRAIDAYARAYNLANKDTKETAEYRKSLRDRLEALYKIRFDSTSGIDAYVSTVMSKPMPDPTTAVVPVALPTTTTTTTTTTSTVTAPTTDSTTKSSTTTDTTTTKPTSNTVTKPVTGGGKTTTTKKKGTR